MSNLPLQPLVWSNKNHARSAFHDYLIDWDQDARKHSKAKYVVKYGEVKSDISFNVATGFATIDDAKAWCWNHYNEKMQPYVNPDSITDIADWFKKAKPEPTDKDICVQLGCHFEEIVEMLDELKEDEANPIMHEIANYMKSPDGGEVVALDDKVNFLDALCDQIVTATGVAYMMGFDIEGALKEVVRSNNSKMVDGKFIFDDNGKICKPESYSKPDLTPFVSTMQNLHKGGDCE